MDIKPIGPANIGYGNVEEASNANTPKTSFPAPQTPAAIGAPAAPAAELEALAGLGKVEDLNDPEKSRAIVRQALSIVAGPELSQLSPAERDNLTEWMANDPSISGRTLKLMSKVLRGD
jgi:hypothetical protein